MAFSSFKLLMAASGGSAPPPATNDTYGSEVQLALAQSFNNADLWITSGDTSNYYGAGNGTSSRFIWRINHATTYVQSGNRFTLTSTLGNSPHVHCDTISSTHVLVAYDNLTTIACQNIVNTAGTLSASVAETTVVTGGGSLQTAFCVVLDSTNALVFGGSTTSANNRMSLINPTTLAITQNSTSATSVAYTNSQINLTKISATLAAFCWLNGSNQIQIQTVDVTSGTSFTLNAAFNTTIANGTSTGQLYPLSSTTALFVYYKAANTIAARVVTFAGGGSVSLGTEYTATAAGIPSAFAPFRIAAYGSNYMIGYGEFNASNGGRIFATSVSVSGSVVTFNTSGFSIIGTSSSFSVNFNYNPGMFIPVDSTRIAVTYGGAAQSHYTNTCYININPTISTWGTFSGNNSGNLSLSLIGGGPSVCYTGTNRGIMCGYDASTGGSTLVVQGVTTGGSSPGVSISSGSDTGIVGGVGTLCNLAYSTSLGKCRVLIAYCDLTNSIRVGVIAPNSSNAIPSPTTTTFTATSSNIAPNQNGKYVLVQLGSDSALFLGHNQGVSPDGIGGNVIQVTAGGNTISATNTFTSLINPASEAVQSGSNFLQYSRIDSSRVAIIFMTKNTSTNKYSLKMCILSVSGTTVTVGTIQNIITGYTNPPQNYGIAVLDSGKGIVTYANDASPGTILYGAGFTFSGTTITLGSQNSLATSLSFANRVNGNGNGTMVPVSPTEAMASIVDTGTNRPNLYLLTYVNNNSITAGSPVVYAAGAAIAYGLVPTDTPNDLFWIWNSSSTFQPAMNQYFRG